MASKIVEMEELRVGKQKVRDASVEGGPMPYVKVLAGKEEHPIRVDLRLDKTQVSFNTKKLELPKGGKIPRMMDYYQAATFEKGKEGEFAFYFNDPFAAHAPAYVNVKVTKDELYFPGILKPWDVQMLNYNGANIVWDGPSINEVNKVLKMLKGSLELRTPAERHSPSLRDFDARRDKIEGAFNEIAKFRKQIEWAAGLPKDLKKLQESKEIKELMKQAKETATSIKEGTNSMRSGFEGLPLQK